MSQDAAEYSRKSFEEASAALKSFAEVKSATDFFKLQGDLPAARSMPPSPRAPASARPC